MRASHTVTVTERKQAAEILNRVWMSSSETRRRLAQSINIPEAYISTARNMTKRWKSDQVYYYCPHWVVKRVIEWSQQ